VGVGVTAEHYRNKWSGLRPGQFAPEKAPDTHLKGDWVDIRAGAE